MRWGPPAESWASWLVELGEAGPVFGRKAPLRNPQRVRSGTQEVFPFSYCREGNCMPSTGPEPWTAATVA